MRLIGPFVRLTSPDFVSLPKSGAVLASMIRITAQLTVFLVIHIFNFIGMVVGRREGFKSSPFPQQHSQSLCLRKVFSKACQVGARLQRAVFVIAMRCCYWSPCFARDFLQ